MKDIDNLANLYTDEIKPVENLISLNESETPSDDTLTENVEVGVLKPETTDAFGNGPLSQPVGKFAETGPNSVDTQDPIETQSDEPNAMYSKPVSQKKQKKQKNLEKTMQEGINIETMSKEKNVFDKLYAVIMEEDHDLEDIDLDFEDELDTPEDDEGYDEVTISLPKDIARQLCDSLKSQLEDDDELDGLEDLEDLDDGDDEDVFPENVETGEVKTNSKPEAAPDGSTKAGNKAEWNVKGKASKTDAGHAKHKGEVKTNSKPEAAPDGSTKAGNKAEWNVKNTGKMPGDH